MSSPVYSIGSSRPICIYDVAVVLGMIVDTLGYDHESEFGRVLLDLCNSAWESLPDTLMFDFREPPCSR